MFIASPAFSLLPFPLMRNQAPLIFDMTQRNVSVINSNCFQNSMSFASTMPCNPSDKEDGDPKKAGPMTMSLPKCSLDHIYQACNLHQNISRNPVEKSPSISTQQPTFPPLFHPTRITYHHHHQHLSRTNHVLLPPAKTILLLPRRTFPTRITVRQESERPPLPSGHDVLLHDDLL